MSKPLYVVTMKVVPKTEEIRFDPNTKTVDRSKATNEINQADKNALEEALKLKERYGGRVLVLSMGPPFFDPFLRIALAMGADDAILISDRVLAGSDAYVTSMVLARAIQKIGGATLVLCGEESSDGSTGQVPPGIAAWLGYSQATYVSKILDLDLERGRVVVRRTIKGGYEDIELPIPAVLSIELGINTPRFPDFRRKKWAEKEYKLTIWSAADLGLKPDEVGLIGSPSRVRELVEIKPPERARRIIENIDEGVEEFLRILKSI
ncbi:MAG: electron transfer flavoprotein subunit beta/FixA family protein [Sulfolobales archaeon]